jgi:hypothetical protein
MSRQRGKRDRSAQRLDEALHPGRPETFRK